MEERKFNDNTEKTEIDMTMEYIDKVIKECKIERPAKWAKEDGEDEELRYEDFQAVMNKMCDNNHRIGVEFECGDCCKKVTNAAKVFFIFGNIVLLPDPCESLILKAFSGGRLVDKQVLRVVVVPRDRLCAFEVERKHGRR